MLNFLIFVAYMTPCTYWAVLAAKQDKRDNATHKRLNPSNYR